MITLPKTVQVGWKTFKVEVWDPVAAANARRYGECDHIPAIIRIDVTHGDAQTMECLLHELIHAAIEVGSLSHGDLPMQWDEERVVSFMGSWLSTLLRHNPEIAKLVATVYAPSALM
jgi:hypothetical protein